MKIFFTALILLSLLSLAANLHAASNTIDKQQAVNIATQAYPGRVIAVKHRSKTYQVKTLSESGKLHVITIDANTGDIRSGKKSAGKKSGSKKSNRKKRDR